jgi:hypothetical protein
MKILAAKSAQVGQLQPTVTLYRGRCRSGCRRRVTSARHGQPEWVDVTRVDLCCGASRLATGVPSCDLAARVLPPGSHANVGPSPFPIAGPPSLSSPARYCKSSRGSLFYLFLSFCNPLSLGRNSSACRFAG